MDLEMYETCMNRLDVCSDVVLGEMLKYNYALYQKMREKLGEAWDADGAAELQRIYDEGKKIENRIEEGRIYNQEREKSVLRDIGVLSSLWDDYREAYEAEKLGFEEKGSADEALEEMKTWMTLCGSLGIKELVLETQIDGEKVTVDVVNGVRIDD